ncbi:MAG: DegT/DnrJ/EryC1/StrS family aminotransferase [Victivallaceae bacterium]|nr:DegT/DnrJ/EryC1/StrS family aminotransferase [Victivallaceae bacterium]
MQFLDMKAPYLELKDKLDAAYLRFMNSGRYVLGPETEEFEKLWAEYCGCRYCVGVSNGLDALCLGLEAGGVSPGDEVIVPANTYIATWLAVSHVGAVPVPVEPEEKSFNIDPAKIEAAITAKTTAIAAVHLFGRPADMEPVMAIAKKHNLFVLEDNAQSQGAFCHGRRTGHLGHAAAFSFYPAKNIGAFGEAGCVTTDDHEIADRVRVLRNYGSRIKYHNELKGYNRRIDDLQAAFLAVKIPYLDEWNARRRNIAERYFAGLSGIPGVRLPEYTPADSVWHQFVIRVENRDAVRESLRLTGIPTMIHYPVPPHLSAAYRELGFRRGDFPLTERLADTFLSLPIGPHMPAADAEEVIAALRAVIAD